jgi:hypothetical protein
MRRPAMFRPSSRWNQRRSPSRCHSIRTAGNAGRGCRTLRRRACVPELRAPAGRERVPLRLVAAVAAIDADGGVCQFELARDPLRHETSGGRRGGLRAAGGAMRGPAPCVDGRTTTAAVVAPRRRRPIRRRAHGAADPARPRCWRQLTPNLSSAQSCWDKPYRSRSTRDTGVVGRPRAARCWRERLSAPTMRARSPVRRPRTPRYWAWNEAAIGA